MSRGSLFGIFGIVLTASVANAQIRTREINCCEVGVNLATGGANLKWEDNQWHIGLQLGVNFSYYFTDNFGLRFAPNIAFIFMEDQFTRFELLTFPIYVLFNFQLAKHSFLTLAPGGGFGRGDLKREYRYAYYHEITYSLGSATGIGFGGDGEIKQRIANCVFLNLGIGFWYMRFENFPDLYVITPKIGISAVW